MSKKNGLGKLYDRFRPEERFRLVLEAQARGDEQETRKLVSTCPRREYTMTEAEYTDRMISASSLVQLVALDLAPRIARAKMIEGFEEALPFTYNSCANEASFAHFDGHRDGVRWAWEKAGASLDGDTPEPEDEEYDEAGLTPDERTHQSFGCERRRRESTKCRDQHPAIHQSSEQRPFASSIPLQTSPPPRLLGSLASRTTLLGVG